jgi:hypothetical protein
VHKRFEFPAEYTGLTHANGLVNSHTISKMSKNFGTRGYQGIPVWEKEDKYFVKAGITNP